MEPARVNLREYQEAVRQWSQHNFGDQPSWKPLLGIGEEVGELNHAYLKREQGIRQESHGAFERIRDAVGDIMIYLLDFCSREGIDAEIALAYVWQEVSQRDWKRFPKDGVSV